MTSIKEDVEYVLKVAYQKIEQNPCSEYVPGVQTERTIVFNSRLWDILIKESKENHRHFGEIRKNDPLLFHQLLGIYYGDLKMKDQIYKLTNDKDSYSLQAIVLTPGISLKKFYNKKKKLCDILFDDYGSSEFYKTDKMGHAESVLNHFHDNHPFSFKKTKFLYVAHVKNRDIITYPLTDYVLIQNGYAVNKKAQNHKIPKEKKDYQGPFIHLISRGEKKHFEKHLDIIGKLIEALE